MIRVLITAYGPYDEWQTNASWLAVQALTRDMPSSLEESIDLTTRLYPVDFEEVRKRLAGDIKQGYDVALHLGQAPGLGTIGLEAFGINVGRGRTIAKHQAAPLEPNGPAAYRSQLPLEAWRELLGEAGIPSQVSFHAGDYLCNAALYWSHYFAEQYNLPTAATFLHLPLDTSQAIAAKRDQPSLPAETSALGIRLMLETLPALMPHLSVDEREIV